MTEGSGGGTEGQGGDGTPLLFRQAVGALIGTRPRQEVRITELPAPKRLAPHSYALEATVVAPTGAGGGPDDDAEEEQEELADGRFVLLYDPDGQEAWQSVFRIVTLARADLEPEMANDPLLPEVTWSWLTGALEARSASYAEPSGTVTRVGSQFFGRLGDRTPESELELRASWTPVATGSPSVPPELTVHLAAWCELLCQCAGLPPEGGDGAPVVPLPQRRGPRAT
jgi:hypothetical protein